MTAWQVEFYIIPKRALADAPSPLPIEMLDTAAWWTDVALPPDYRARLNAAASPAKAPSPDLETWGVADANYIEVRSTAGRPSNVRACVDVRRPDAKFAAGLITFARVAGAALVGIDGSAIEPTAGGFGTALRESPAWRYVQSKRVRVEEES